jgi:hypothetical protein
MAIGSRSRRRAKSTDGADSEATASPVPRWVHNVGLNIRVDVVTAEVVEALRAEGIPSVLLKGPATVRLLYEDEPPRPYGDVDLLVPPAVGQAETVLASLGFVPPHDAVGYDQWVRETDGASVDLHRTFFGVEIPPETVWRILSRDTEPLVVAGTQVEVLSVPPRAVILSLHAAAHGPRSKAGKDLARALERLDEGIWAQAAQLAEELQATTAFAAGLRLLPQGESLAERLGLPKWLTVSLALSASGAPPAALMLERLATTRGARAKVALAMRRVIPPRSWIRVWAAQDPRRPSNLVLAYFWRLGFLAHRAPPAFRAWRRARRLVRRRARPRPSVPAREP